MIEVKLPADIYNPEDPAAAWQNLQDQTSEALGKRVDLIGSLALEERLQGERGWRERVRSRLGAGEDVGEQVISATVKAFDLFRLPEANGGLGWSRGEVSRHSWGKLRVFAQNADWSRRNPDRVRAMLDEGASEVHIRATVREAKAAQEEGREERTDEWKRIAFKVPPSQIAFVEAALQAARRKLERTEGLTFHADAGIAAGQLLFALMGNWAQGAEVYNHNGEEVEVLNAEYFEGAMRDDLMALYAPEEAAARDVA